jgi:hypothetical protein
MVSRDAIPIDSASVRRCLLGSVESARGIAPCFVPSGRCVRAGGLPLSGPRRPLAVGRGSSCGGLGLDFVTLPLACDGRYPSGYLS